MSAIKPVIREVRQAVLKGMAHAKDKLPQAAENIENYLKDFVTQWRKQDVFDSPDASRTADPFARVPRPECLTPDGKIDWDKAPHDGFKLGTDGKPIFSQHVPQAGDRFDRYGSPYGTFTSPIPEDGPFSYESRSLPYEYNPNTYHQYEWLHSPADAQAVYDQLDDATREVVDIGLANEGVELSDLTSVLRGEAAGVPDWGTPGGATQDMLPASVGLFDNMGMIKEVK